MVGGPLKMSYQLVQLQKGGGTLLILALWGWWYPLNFGSVSTSDSLLQHFYWYHSTKLLKIYFKALYETILKLLYIDKVKKHLMYLPRHDPSQPISIYIQISSSIHFLLLNCTSRHKIGNFLSMSSSHSAIRAHSYISWCRVVEIWLWTKVVIRLQVAV